MPPIELPVDMAAAAEDVGVAMAIEAPMELLDPMSMFMING